MWSLSLRHYMLAQPCVGVYECFCMWTFVWMNVGVCVCATVLMAGWGSEGSLRCLLYYAWITWSRDTSKALVFPCCFWISHTHPFISVCQQHDLNKVRVCIFQTVFRVSPYSKVKTRWCVVYNLIERLFRPSIHSSLEWLLGLGF